MPKPYLIVVTGRPGAGKSTFARALGQQAFLPVVSRDEIKEGFVHTQGVRHSELPPDANLTATNLFFQTAEGLLAGDGQLALDRFLRRGLDNPWRGYFHGDKGVEMVKQGLTVQVGPYDPPHLDVPTYTVDTTDGYSPSIAELMREILGM